jgi:hypothetical protein
VQVRSGEDARAALARALRGALGRRFTVGEEVAACERILTHRALTLRAFPAEPAGEIPVDGGLRWVPASRLEACGMPAAFRALLAGMGAEAGPRQFRARAGARARAR